VNGNRGLLVPKASQRSQSTAAVYEKTATTATRQANTAMDEAAVAASHNTTQPSSKNDRPEFSDVCLAG